MAGIDWVQVNNRLPYKRNQEQKEKRKELWSSIDINGNGYVSLAEITKVIISISNNHIKERKPILRNRITSNNYYSLLCIILSSNSFIIVNPLSSKTKLFIFHGKNILT